MIREKFLMKINYLERIFKEKIFSFSILGKRGQNGATPSTPMQSDLHFSFIGHHSCENELVKSNVHWYKYLSVLANSDTLPILYSEQRSIYSLFGRPGEDGENGQHGFKAGKGGPVGSVQLFSLREPSKINIVSKKGKDGLPGKGGRGGEGGVNGADIEIRCTYSTTWMLAGKIYFDLLQKIEHGKAKDGIDGLNDYYGTVLPKEAVKIDSPAKVISLYKSFAFNHINNPLLGNGIKKFLQDLSVNPKILNLYSSTDFSNELQMLEQDYELSVNKTNPLPYQLLLSAVENFEIAEKTLGKLEDLNVLKQLQLEISSKLPVKSENSEEPHGFWKDKDEASCTRSEIGTLSDDCVSSLHSSATQTTSMLNRAMHWTNNVARRLFSAFQSSDHHLATIVEPAEKLVSHHVDYFNGSVKYVSFTGSVIINPTILLLDLLVRKITKVKPTYPAAAFENSFDSLMDAQSAALAVVEECEILMRTTGGEDAVENFNFPQLQKEVMAEMMQQDTESGFAKIRNEVLSNFRGFD
jgi:hypothetical protein